MDVFLGTFLNFVCIFINAKAPPRMFFMMQIFKNIQMDAYVKSNLLY